MNEYTFRVTQPLVGYYEGDVTIEANSEKEGKELLENMSNDELDSICENWEQSVDDAEPDGDIEIQQLIRENE